MLIEQNKYIAVTPQRILCVKGWVLKSLLNDNQVKLFKTPSHIEQFFETARKSYGKPKYEVKKVKVRIEVEDYE